jgi:hypothetical protein
VGSQQTIAPAAIVALKEALTLVYWYKSDLRSFLTNLIDEPAILARLNWQDYKRNIVGALVDFLAANQKRYQQQLLKLMTEVSRIEDFTHLTHLEDGREKASRATSAVTALRALLAPHEQILAEQKAAEARRQAAYERSLKSQAVQSALQQLNDVYLELLKPGDPHRRGYKLERILRELFSLFDLDPKASFKILGEQVDGAFTFDNTDYLLEAKWQRDPAGTQDLDAFAGKINRKLENTLGMFLSVNGFMPNAVQIHSTVRPVMILVDGSDLLAVLEGRIDLIKLLLRKRRHASQTGEIYLPVYQILT